MTNLEKLKDENIENVAAFLWDHFGCPEDRLCEWLKDKEHPYRHCLGCWCEWLEAEE